MAVKHFQTVQFRITLHVSVVLLLLNLDHKMMCMLHLGPHFKTISVALTNDTKTEYQSDSWTESNNN